MAGGMCITPLSLFWPVPYQMGGPGPYASWRRETAIISSYSTWCPLATAEESPK